MPPSRNREAGSRDVPRVRVALVLVVMLLAGCGAPPEKPTPATNVTPPTATSPPTPPPPTPPPTPPSNGTVSDPSNPQPPGVFSTTGGVEIANITQAPSDAPLPNAVKDRTFEAPAGGRIVFQVRIDPGPATAQVGSTASVLQPDGSEAFHFSPADISPRDYRVPGAQGKWTVRFTGSTSNTVHVVAIAVS